MKVPPELRILTQVKLLTDLVERFSIVNIRSVYSLFPSRHESERRKALAMQNRVEDEIPIVRDSHLFTPTRKDRATANYQG
jgi:hypothetical protein